MQDMKFMNSSSNVTNPISEQDFQKIATRLIAKQQACIDNILKVLYENEN